MLPTYIFTRIISNVFLSSSVMPFLLFFIFVLYVILNCTNCICVFDRKEKIKSLEVSLLATLSISRTFSEGESPTLKIHHKHCLHKFLVVFLLFLSCTLSRKLRSLKNLFFLLLFYLCLSYLV